MDQQCESFSRIFSSATGLDKSFMFIRNTWTSSSINENWQISTFQNFQLISKILVFIKFHKISKFSKNFKILKLEIKIENFPKILEFQKFQKNSKFS
jgi:hypothetical protein